MKKLVGLAIAIIVGGAFFITFLPGLFRSKKLFQQSELIGKIPPNFEVIDIKTLYEEEGKQEGEKSQKENKYGKEGEEEKSKTLQDVISEAEKEGKIVLINFFASWCNECKEERFELMKFKKNAKIVGVVFQDTKKNIRDYLKEVNPYDYIFFDKGEISIDYGVTGVPETFVVKDGKIVKKFLGRFSPQEIVNLSTLEKREKLEYGNN